MSKFLTQQQISDLAIFNGYEVAALKAVIDVESSGHGFSSDTGKIIIQFEPIWFKRQFNDWKNFRQNHKWITNQVSNQSVEWEAFNDAFSIDPNAAMESTSIGLMQVMAFHFKRIGFKSAGEMWDYAKESEANQVDIGIRFIKSKPVLDNAIKKRLWPVFAYFYNGKEFKKFSYDTRLSASYSCHQIIS